MPSLRSPLQCHWALLQLVFHDCFNEVKFLVLNSWYFFFFLNFSQGKEIHGFFVFNAYLPFARINSNSVLFILDCFVWWLRKETQKNKRNWTLKKDYDIKVEERYLHLTGYFCFIFWVGAHNIGTIHCKFILNQLFERLGSKTVVCKHKHTQSGKEFWGVLH